MREAKSEELERWDDLVAVNPDGGNVLQSQAFAEAKSMFGWKPKYFVLESGIRNQESVAVLFLARKTPLGELWYCPKGPGVATQEQLNQIMADLGTPKGVFLAKLEPELSTFNFQLSSGLVKARDIQLNSSTVIADLRPAEEELLASLKQKTRYNIRLAAKRGVKVKPVELTAGNMAKMYELMRSTRDRAGFFLRSKKYFTTFWEAYKNRGQGQLFFAYAPDSTENRVTRTEKVGAPDLGTRNSEHGTPVAGAFVIFLGKKALYKDGGSTREHSELQAPYLLQWEIMRWLKEKGIEHYDLHGTPPSNRLDDQNHQLHGLVQFKTGFGPVTDFAGTLDLPLKTLSYRLWELAGERLISAYYYRMKKELFY